jgi:hypothetical protein
MSDSAIKAEKLAAARKKVTNAAWTPEKTSKNCN